MILIGLTGGICSGKSTISRYLSTTLNVPVFDTDKIAHEAYYPNTSTYHALIDEFGKDIVDDSDQSIDRKKLGAIVFKDKAKLTKLSALVWPATWELTKQRIGSYEQSHPNDPHVCVVEAALLIESGLYKKCDYVWCVAVSREVAIERLCHRNNLTISQAQDRLNSQIDNEQRKPYADVWLNSEDTFQNNEKNILLAWNRLFLRIHVEVTRTFYIRFKIKYFVDSPCQHLMIKSRHFPFCSHPYIVMHRDPDYEESGLWSVQLDFQATPLLLKKLNSSLITYDYCVGHFDDVVVADSHHPVPIRNESSGTRTLNTRALLSVITAGHTKVEIHDWWRNTCSHEHTFFNTSFFRKVIYHRPSQQQSLSENQNPNSMTMTLQQVNENFFFKEPVFKEPEKKLVQVTFFILCTTVGPSESIGIFGSCKSLKSWNKFDPLLFNSSDFPLWKITVPIHTSEFPFEYKYVKYNEQNKTIDFEAGPNRYCTQYTDNYLFINDDSFRIAPADIPWRGVGVAIPVSGLRTEKSFGVGEFGDLLPLADWCSQAGLRVIQILPVNDTSIHDDWRDSYPYSPLSSFALHPLYLRLIELTSDKELLKELKDIAIELNLSPTIHYEKVMKNKWYFIEKIYNEAMKVEKLYKEDMKFKEFIDDNKDWLYPYAIFCSLKRFYSSVNFRQHWNSEYLTLSFDQMTSIVHTHVFSASPEPPPRIQTSSSIYCEEKGIALKGDLPIGVNLLSVDTWCHPELFRMEQSVGAPPDDFAQEGQNWLFPSYDWAALKNNDYSWFKRRLAHMSRYFHSYRIDHILGFFRIWEIERCNDSGVWGIFNPSHGYTTKELLEHGFHDLPRLFRPYIRYHNVQNLFGARTTQVISHYFSEYMFLCYEFKDDYNSERNIKNNAKADDIEGLLVLFGNVCLLKDEHGNYHPRIDLESIPSFQELPHVEQHTLRKLHHKHYYEKQEALWEETGRERLSSAMLSTPMLVCGEDLGLIPPCVTRVMEDLGILCYRIQRFPPANSGKQFFHPSEYSYLTCCSTSNHDMSSFRGWWEEDYQRAQKFYTSILGFFGECPKKAKPYIVEAVIKQHFQSKAMLNIIPLQDFFALQSDLSDYDPKFDQINNPQVFPHYWKFRMHVSLEDLENNHKEFTLKIKSMVCASNRI